MFKHFCYTTIFVLPQNHEQLHKIRLKQTFQKAIIYFKNSAQQLFRRNLASFLNYFQYQMRCYRCMFKFLNTKIEKIRPLCYINFMYQLSTFYSESKKRNLTFKKNFKKECYKQHLKIALEEIPITSLRLHLGKWDFHCSQKKLFKLPPKPVSITCNIFNGVSFDF